MKKIFVISIVGVLIGTVFAFYMFSNIKETVATVVEDKDTVTAFQVGVFSIYDNAKKVADSHSNAYIYEDEDKYRVFLAIYQDAEIINYMTDYYEEKAIEVYLKKMNVNKTFLEQLKKYESLLKETTDKETYISANKNILGAFARTI